MNLAAAYLAMILGLGGCCPDPPVPVRKPLANPLPSPPPVIQIELPKGIPLEAVKYRGIIVREVTFFWGERGTPQLFMAQIHQESMWKPDARSSHASGLAQFTPPTAEWIQSLYAADLKALCPQNIGCPLDARWAIRSGVLYDRKLYDDATYAQGWDRWAFALAGYNGGAGWIARERIKCGERVGCSPSRYFGHVQRMCGQTTPARSPMSCLENNRYPEIILRKHLPLYDSWFQQGASTCCGS